MTTLRRTLLFSASVLAALPAQAGLFGGPEPELIYSGAAPDLAEGVIVIRDDESFAQAIAPLDPAFGAAKPIFADRTVLRIVGRVRENSCRETALLEVSTRGTNATVTLEERIPPAECPCRAEARSPRVYLVAVGRGVRNAQVTKTDRVIPCPEGAAVMNASSGKPNLVFEGSWDAEPGARVIVDAAAYRDLAKALGLGERAPQIDFEQQRLIAVTGRARENGCRRTKVVSAALAAREEAVFEIEETYPGAGQMCTQIFGQPKVFLYRVPATVMRARVVTREVR
jgi:hypothetical protein